MSTNGIRTIESAKYSIFYVDILSDEFKQLVREQLQGIWSGFSEIDSSPEFYSYKYTLSSFLDRYNSKTDETKKGMIGELLSHVLINNHNSKLKSLSILKNKEERSIKKGFDIIYFHLEYNSLWYCEVKSGSGKNGTKATANNLELLNRSKNDISDKFSQHRNSLWENALYDVSAMIKDESEKLNMKQILANDSPQLNTDDKKSVILISSLFHNTSDSIEEQSIVDYLSTNLKENNFSDIIIVSIQKNTFEAVADFLTNELNGH